MLKLLIVTCEGGRSAFVRRTVPYRKGSYHPDAGLWCHESIEWVVVCYYPGKLMHITVRE